MTSINYTSVFNNSNVNSASGALWNAPEDFQFSSDLFVDFETPLLFANDEIQNASKKIYKLAPISEVKEASKPSCQRRARKGRNPWTPKEDTLLMELMKKYGQSWAMISSALPGRTGKQVRDRYLNKLRPHIRCGDWRAEEDECIVNLCKEIGNRWSLIATHLPGRTEAQVKNRYYSHIKKRLDSNGALSQTTASRTISEGFNSAITSPQAEDVSFDFRQGYEFNMFNGCQIENVDQVSSSVMTNTTQSSSPQTVYSTSPYFSAVESDSQIDEMLNQVTNHFRADTNKSANDVDFFFSNDLNRNESAESLIFSNQDSESAERYEQLSKRKAYLELALAKTLKEMKGL